MSVPVDEDDPRSKPISRSLSVPTPYSSAVVATVFDAANIFYGESQTMSRDCPEHIDVRIGNQWYRASGNILQTVSKYFETIMACGMAEQKAGIVDFTPRNGFDIVTAEKWELFSQSVENAGLEGVPNLEGAKKHHLAELFDYFQVSVDHLLQGVQSAIKDENEHLIEILLGVLDGVLLLQPAQFTKQYIGLLVLAFGESGYADSMLKLSKLWAHLLSELTDDIKKNLQYMSGQELIKTDNKVAYFIWHSVYIRASKKWMDEVDEMIEEFESDDN